MADREFEAGQNAVAGTFASSEDLYDITGRYEKTSGRFVTQNQLIYRAKLV